MGLAMRKSMRENDLHFRGFPHLYDITLDLYYLYIYILVGGIPTPLKNDGVKVSWDDDIPNMMGKTIHSCSSHHQPVYISLTGWW